MQAKTFIELVDEVLDDLRYTYHKEAFAENLLKLGVKDRKFSEWMMTYLAWSELGSEEDVARHYWHLEAEEENAS